MAGIAKAAAEGLGAVATNLGSVERMQQAGLQAMGKADQTLDMDFNGLDAELKRVSGAVAALDKAVRMQQGRIFANTEALSQIGFEVERAFTIQEVDNKEGLQIFRETVKQYNELVRPKLTEVFDERVFAPLNEFKGRIEAAAANVRARNAAQLDYDAARRKLRSLISKQSTEPATMQQAEARQTELQLAYEQGNEAVKDPSGAQMQPLRMLPLR
jgi:hypothetical protein